MSRFNVNLPTSSAEVKPTDNAFIEALNSKLRREYLNAHWYLSLQDAYENWWPGVDTTAKSDRTALSGISPHDAGKLSRCNQPTGFGKGG